MFSVVVDRHTPLPHIGTNLGSVHSFSIQAGQLAFAANPSPPFDSIDGVYSIVTGAVQRVVSVASPVGAYNANVFAQFGNVLVRSNQVLFKAGGSFGLGPEAIFKSNLDGTQVQELVSTRTTVPGTTNSFPPGFTAFDYENGLLVFESACYCATNSRSRAELFAAARRLVTSLPYFCRFRAEHEAQKHDA